MKTEELVQTDICCGCGLCRDKCPKSAISMVESAMGAVYPSIDADRCVDCRLCQKLCPAGKKQENSGGKFYGAVNQKKKDLLSSASGGVFSALARTVLENGGTVYGAALLPDEKQILKAKHIRITAPEEILQLQGSKYLQSDMSGVYGQIAEDLRSGRQVLFSGTPCQTAAVKSAYGDDENLVLAEIICHGTPSQRMFTEYLQTLGKGETVKDFRFRSKKSGWGLCASLTLQDAKGREKNKLIPSSVSSYYKMFLRGELYRESCYHCRYAKAERVGDLTLGDYWGVEKDTAAYTELKQKGFEVTEGVSCVIASTEKGEKLLKQSDLFLTETTFENISKENKQLLQPSARPASREEVRALYEKDGYAGLERRFQKALGAKKYLLILRKRISPKIRMKMRLLLKK